MSASKHVLYQGRNIFPSGIPVALADGGWAIVGTLQNRSQGLYQALFDAQGQLLDPTLAIAEGVRWSNEPTAFDAIGDNWLVSWSEATEDGSGRQIMQQRLDSTGALLGEPIKANTETDGLLYAGSATEIEGGSWISSWYTRNNKDTLSAIKHFQAFDADGARLGVEHTVNSNLTPFFVQTGEGYDALYTTRDEFGGGYDLMIEGFGAGGEALDGTRKLADIDIEKLREGQILQLRDGSWLVSAISRGEVTDRLIQQRFGTDGTPIGDIEDLGSTGGKQHYSAIQTEVLENGGWVTTWKQEVENKRTSQIVLLAHDGDGNPMSDPVVLKTGNTVSQPRLDALADGGWIVSWNTSSSRLFENGVYFQRFDSFGQSVENNNAPSAVDTRMEIGIGTEHHFRQSEFRYTDLEGNGLSAVMITDYSINGHLALNGAPVETGDTILATDLPDLVWSQSVAATGANVGQVWFQLVDDGGASATDRNTDPVANVISFDVLPAKFGTQGKDAMTAGKTDGFLYGLGGSDVLEGGATNDRLVGGAGKDEISGGDGDDIIDGGKGNDVLTGGKGVDTFVFRKGYGRDEITFFRAREGDIIDLSDFDHITSITQLVQHTHDRFRGVAIRLDDTDMLYIGGRERETLQDKHFIFYGEI